MSEQIVQAARPLILKFEIKRKYYLDSTLKYKKFHQHKRFFLIVQMTMQETSCGGVLVNIHRDYSHDSVDCFWLVKNADPVLHILYHTQRGNNNG